MPMATKPRRVVIYNEKLPSIKTKDPLITWSRNKRSKLNTYLYYHKCYDY